MSRSTPASLRRSFLALLPALESAAAAGDAARAASTLLAARETLDLLPPRFRPDCLVALAASCSRIGADSLAEAGRLALAARGR